eukprot:CAMPEP_0117522852 /NCGR_PEP_ID=MMETSP0784-20121206/34422_1 /TAXON_ID=39447 /ORGANISM="" /LENGTH=41 /DNA_ID= /DNA_START= /DNA_END= /DNA_ORIENTATION=
MPDPEGGFSGLDASALRANQCSGPLAVHQMLCAAPPIRRQV